MNTSIQAPLRLTAPTRFSLTHEDEQPPPKRTFMDTVYQKANETTPPDVTVNGWAKLFVWALGQYGPAVVVPTLCAVFFGALMWSMYQNNVATTKQAIESVTVQAKASSDMAAAMSRNTESMSKISDAVQRLSEEVAQAHLRAVGAGK